MSVRDIQGQLQDLYGVEVSAGLISNVTPCRGGGTQTLRSRRRSASGQNRSLELVYPIVYFDAIVVKVRHEGRVANKAIHLALLRKLGGY
jgi:transposase-like protein